MSRPLGANIPEEQSTPGVEPGPLAVQLIDWIDPNEIQLEPIGGVTQAAFGFTVTACAKPTEPGACTSQLAWPVETVIDAAKADDDTPRLQRIQENPRMWDGRRVMVLEPYAYLKRNPVTGGGP